MNSIYIFEVHQKIHLLQNIECVEFVAHLQGHTKQFGCSAVYERIAESAFSTLVCVFKFNLFFSNCNVCINSTDHTCIYMATPKVPKAFEHQLLSSVCVCVLIIQCISSYIIFSTLKDVCRLQLIILQGYAELDTQPSLEDNIWKFIFSCYALPS